MKRSKSSDECLVPIKKGSIVVLAFDCKRLGSPASFYLPIEIGISVVGEYPALTEFDRFSYSEYRSEKLYESNFPFEQRCKEEFWDKNAAILEAIELDTDKKIDVEASRSLMIHGAVMFIKKWEEKAKNEGFELMVISDNKICDPTSINIMIEKYMNSLHPQLPYSFAFPGKYTKIFELDSVILGILYGLSDINYAGKQSQLEQKLEKHFDFKIENVQHSHRSVDDAKHMASYFQACLGICVGQIKKREIETKTLTD